MGKLGFWVKCVSLVYVLILFLLLFLYDAFVPTGSWGSFSDIAIAAFTFLISLATSLLFIAAWFAGKSWKVEREFDQASEVIGKFVHFYSHCLDARGLQVKTFIYLDEIKDSTQTEGELYEKHSGNNVELNKAIDNLKSQLAAKSEAMARAEQDHAEVILTIDALEKDILIISTHFEESKALILQEALNELRKVKVDFHDNFNKKFALISSSLLGTERSLPKLIEPESFQKYKKFDDFLDVLFNSDD
ncbi:hypothetical protein FQP85_21990 [Pseudoalteromonas neustonica]|uniref:Uncharacterized protein n=1 Tax=Pseudoalteromonas neustonica TaxID=1840331 RepID=A0ABY3F7H8_9GAMM|nr:hypothetical protein [Pseudoalteromonas neustonica]TVU79866.1 hypothetical protein FQP85_21990 [Pseudoalteromonas neustonica]